MKLFGFVLLLFLPAACTQPHGPSVDYPDYGGNKANNRYSPLKQIDLTNVAGLEPAWIYNSADTVRAGGRHPEHDIQCQPIVVDGILYGVSPTLKLFAVHAATGEELWKFDPFRFAVPRFNQCRGLAYWTDGKDRRLFYA